MNALERPPDRGLSPRVRGNPERRIIVHSHIGSIPACAGEPTTSFVPPVTTEVYPRVCGGTSCGPIFSWPRCGLSPRVRGNPPSDRRAAHCSGSIPACAGEPCARRSPCSTRRVYPRVCGGTKVRAFRRAVCHGLSPRVRGNPNRTVIARRRSGSIPACAGEPKTRTGLRASRRVYPRVCGGTGPAPGLATRHRGLSPRVRGNRVRHRRRRLD